MTFPTLSEKMVAETPPLIQGFRGWDLGALGVNNDGSTFGEPGRETGVWPVGPNSFIVAEHVGWLTKNAVRFLGVDYPVVEVHQAGNDLLQIRVEGQIPQWHAVWRGWFQRPTVPGNPSIALMAPIDISGWRVCVVAGGNGACGLEDAATLNHSGDGQKKRWFLYEHGGCEASYGPYGTTNQTMGDTVGPDLRLRCAVNGELRIGYIIGDSSGGVFIRDPADGRWYLAGVLLAGAYGANFYGIAPLAFNAPMVDTSFYATRASYHEDAVQTPAPTLPPVLDHPAPPPPPAIPPIAPQPVPPTPAPPLPAVSEPPAATGPITIPKGLREQLHAAIASMREQLTALEGVIDKTLGKQSK